MATFLQRIKDSSFAEFRISGLEAGRARTALGYLKKRVARPTAHVLPVASSERGTPSLPGRIGLLYGLPTASPPRGSTGGFI